MPVIQSIHEASQTATTKHSPSRGQTPRQSIKAQDLGVGCIVWLPSKGNDDDRNINCIRKFCCSNQELSEAGHNHPVVIVQVSATSSSETLCFIAQVTSKERNRSYRLRISQKNPAEPPYDSNCETELHLESGTMHKQSYVVLEHIFQVLPSHLRSFSLGSGSRAYDRRLCEKSYTLLMSSFGLEPAVWVTTIDLKHGLASSQEALLRRPAAQSQTPGNSDNFTLRHPSRQSLRASTNPASPLPNRDTEQGPLLADNKSSRIPGAWNPQPADRGPQYGAYRRSAQNGHVPSTGNNKKAARFFFASLVVLLTVGSLVWWLWQIS